MKLAVKLMAVALIVNASWQLGMEYRTHYKFRESVYRAALVQDQSEEQLRLRVLELAAEYEVPLEPGAFQIRREQRHTYVEGSYAKGVALLPGFQYQWRFPWAVDGYVVKPPTLDDIVGPASSSH
jgi:hypothetical protein